MERTSLIRDARTIEHERSHSWRSSGMSIGARLAVGFGLIAALFFIANLFSRQHAATVGVQIEARNHLSVELDRSARTLTDAVTTLHRAVRELIAADSPQARSDYSAANAALVSEVQRYEQLNAAATLDANALRSAADSLRNNIDATLSAARQRDAAINRYWREFDALQKKFSDSQQSAWRFGDRALTRASMTAMTNVLLQVRTAVDAYLALPNTRRITTIELQEENFLIALAQHANALASAEGDAWLAAVRSDFERLRRLQRNLRAERAATQTAFNSVSLEVDALLGAIRKGLSEPAAQGLIDSATLAHDLARRADRNVALLSLGALFLMLVIAILTARSVTMPVSRLLHATYRLASGEAVVPVERGGARELDQLAAAFNAMALQLAEAKRGVLEQQAKLEERVAERTQQLHYLAYHDALTQLPNRRHLFKHLATILEAARAERQQVVLLLLDLDNFKTLNDSLGHLFGDRVLKAVSQRLLQSVEGDGFAARLGGDEFTLVRRLRLDGDGVAAQAEQLLSRFQRPLRVGNRDILVGLSIGAGVYPDHAHDAESLLRAADSALFHAKAQGRNQTCISSTELVEHISAQFKTEQALRRAIHCDELELLYQPQLRLNAPEVVSVEALLRWRRGGDFVLPLDFLPLAEQSGLITEITDWALRRAVQTLAEWRAGPWQRARIAVNISSQQFIDRMFVGRLQALLVSHNVPPSSLELELTETVLQSGAATVRTLSELRELGVGIALDDFGAGYSSLASLDQLQLSRVKIDRSLIENIDKLPRSAQIARAVIELCRSLDLRVTAEGVERATQLRFLQQCGDVDVQGFLMARPTAADQVLSVCAELPKFLAENLRSGARGTVSYLHRRLDNLN